MNKSVTSVIAALGILLAAAGGYWYGAAGKPAPVPGAATAQAAIAKSGAGKGVSGAVTVELTKVGTAALPQTITAVGSLRSDESVTLRPEVAGRITEILFQEGRRVARGATLVRLDPAIHMADLQQARANLTLAQSKYERALDLAERKFISGQAKDEAKNNLDVAQAVVALAEARLAKMDLKAPFSGFIGLRVVSVGDYVKEGQDLVNIEAIDPLKVDFRVPETFLNLVRVGQEIGVALDALPGRTYEGKVIALNPLVDAAGRTLVIRAQVRNQDTTLRPGMFARVTLITRAEKDALVLPEEALVPQGSDQYVFRVIDGKAARVKVETGQRRGGMVEILKGVEKDDVVVSAGQLKLRDGTPVRVANAGASKGGPADAQPRQRAPKS